MKDSLSFIMWSIVLPAVLSFAVSIAFHVYTRRKKGQEIRNHRAQMVNFIVDAHKDLIDMLFRMQGDSDIQSETREKLHDIVASDAPLIRDNKQVVGLSHVLKQVFERIRLIAEEYRRIDACLSEITVSLQLLLLKFAPSFEHISDTHPVLFENKDGKMDLAATQPPPKIIGDYTSYERDLKKYLGTLQEIIGDVAG